MRSLVLSVFLGVALVWSLLAAAPHAIAADVTLRHTPPESAAVHALPFPRSERAQAIWDERACWSDCGAHTAWGMAACLERDSQGRCLRLADKSDRYCQRACRTSGGPFVPDIFDF
jgi:hypothetical protein